VVPYVSKERVTFHLTGLKIYENISSQTLYSWKSGKKNQLRSVISQQLRSVISQETASHIILHYLSARHWATPGVSLSDWKLWPLQSANDTALGYLNGTVTHHSILYRWLWCSQSTGYPQWGSRSTGR